ncbi:MAG: glycosyltransferase family 2 protein [Pseudomonadota bacterium]
MRSPAREVRAASEPTPQRCVVVIPVYNHGAAVGAVIRESLALGFPVIAVDDGSTDDTARVLSAMDSIRVVSHAVNLGKGAALRSGFREGAATADWAITLDADGQHHPQDAIDLLRAIPKGERPIVVGRRTGMSPGRAPWASRFGRKFSNFWVQMAGGPDVSDTQSGFRIYPLPETLDLTVRARRYQYEIEVLVAARMAGIPVIERPVRVQYTPPGGRVSHYRPLVDFLRNTETFRQLITRRVAAAVMPRRTP